VSTTHHYKVMELNPDEQVWTPAVENVLNEHARVGWKLVTAFERTHEAQQVGSTTAHMPGLISTVLIFKRGGDNARMFQQG
jgi:Domain of unknown function (DUF4177)